MKQRFLALILYGLLVFSAACNDDTTKNEPTSRNATTAVAAPSTTKEVAVAESPQKWNAYVAVANMFRGYLVDHWERYFNFFGDIDEVSQKTQFDESSFITSAFSYETQLKLIDAALTLAAEQPQTALDKEVEVNLKAIRPTVVALGQAREYYSQKSYIADKFAKGNALQKELVANQKGFDDAMTAFFVVVSKANDELQVKQKQKLRDQGKLVLVAILDITESSMALQQLVVTQLNENKDLKTMDIERFKQLYTALVANISELEKYQDNKEALEKEGITLSKAANLRSFIRSSMAVKRAGASVIETFERLGSLTGQVRTPLEDIAKSATQLVYDFNYFINN